MGRVWIQTIFRQIKFFRRPFVVHVAKDRVSRTLSMNFVGNILKDENKILS